MWHTQKVKSFLHRWSKVKEASKEILIDYKNICKDLLYEDEELVRATIDILKNNITTWALSNSPIYSNLIKNDYIEKKDLLDKESWFVDKIRSHPMATSGSTTGYSFSYLRWQDMLFFIECDNHYDLIMDEFSVRDTPELLFFFDIGIKTRSTIEARNNSKNFMEHHGLKRKCNVHYVNFEEFKLDKEKFFGVLVNYLADKQIDVTLSTGPLLNSLCNYLKKHNVKIRVSNLVSNTNEKLLSSTVNSIKSNNFFDKICDHMRCWDGGATFFTCSKENYHLMDNICWCVEHDNKLISTDYFSLASPFINYWNGDLCHVGKEYRRCECGRLYREFEFLENRPFLIKGRNILKIKESLTGFKSIKEVRCSREFIEVVTSTPLQEKDQKTILNSINNLLNYGEKNERDLIKTRFLIEEYG